MATKAEIPSIEGYDWNWTARYLDDVVEELSKSFAAVLSGELPGMPAAQVQNLAGEYARTRGAELLKAASDETRRRIGTLTAQTIEQGESLQSLQATIRTDFSFSKARAELIARTETTKALGQGQKQAAMAQGRDEKRWVTQGDGLVRPEHVANGQAGWIPVGDAFPSGEDTIGLPNCRCSVIYRTSEVQEEPVELVAEVRCPQCNSIVQKAHPRGTPEYCRKCKKEFTA